MSAHRSWMIVVGLLVGLNLNLFGIGCGGPPSTPCLDAHRAARQTHQVTVHGGTEAGTFTAADIPDIVAEKHGPAWWLALILVVVTLVVTLGVRLIPDESTFQTVVSMLASLLAVVVGILFLAGNDATGHCIVWPAAVVLLLGCGELIFRPSKK